MPLHIIRQDITKIKCDAIVNPTNIHLFPGGGTDAAIHEAAGPELLEYCQRLGGCSVGEAKITPAFNLPCKYVIHTAGPEWVDGLSGERVLLRSCYSEALRLAVSHKCHTIAFPLISLGLYGYPKDRVLREATDVISEFLKAHELEVYVVVYDKASYSISLELFSDVQSYIDNFYVQMHSDMLDAYYEDEIYEEHLDSERRKNSRFNDKGSDEESTNTTLNALLCSESEPPSSTYELGDMLENLSEGFADTLFYYIDRKGISDVEAYKRSNVGKKTFSKIKCNKNYKPSKITAVSFAIGLHLNIEEMRHLLSTVVMCLSRADKFDVIIEYFITSGRYETIFDVNEVLYQFDQSLLGV